MQPCPAPSSSVSLRLLLAALAATLVGGAAVAAPPVRAESRGLFLEPRITVLQSGQRLVRVAPNAILAWELAAIPPARVVATAPIALPEGFGGDLPSGTVFGEELGPDGRAACLYAETPPGAPAPEPLCLLDTDGDGRSDRVVSGDRSADVAPVRLSPAPVPTSHPAAATVERRIYVGSTDGKAATIVDQWAVQPSDGLPHYGVSIVGSELRSPWPGRLLLLRTGARASAWGFEFEVRRGPDGQWWVLVSGAMTPWLRVRPPGTIAEFFGGTLERVR